MSPAERGTAMHTVMQHISLKEVPTLTAVGHLLEELLDLEMISPEQADAVSIEQIVHFFHSEIGERLLGAKKISREVPFTMGIPAREVYPDWDGLEESVLVQGIVDCVIEEEEGLIILDYKTDSIEDKYPGGFTQAKNILEKRYRVQVGLYERAIQDIWKKPVIGKYLYFFDGGGILKA